MSLTSASVRTRRLLVVGVATLLVAGVAAAVTGSAQAVVPPEFTISPSSAGPGEQVTVSGTGCSAVGGVVAHVFLYQGAKAVPAGPVPTADLLSSLTTAVAVDGTWTNSITIPQEAMPGPLTFLANCANGNSSQTATPIFWYGQAGSLTLTDGTTTTTEGPTTTTTESPTTTADPATTTTAAPSVAVTPASAAAAVAAAPAFTG